MRSTPKISGSLSNDLPAALVVFLVALPLCLGIALGSNAPLFSGIIAGIVGGVIVGSISGSHVSVSGPAAGLTVIVATAIGKLPAFDVFLLALVIAGILQVVFGIVKAGFLGNFVPAAVIKGMLAAIGLLLILKQFPHLIGYDKDFMGDEEFIQPDHENTFSEIIYSLKFISPVTVFIGLMAIGIQLLWDTELFKSKRLLTLIPAPLVVVLAGVGINQCTIAFLPDMAVRAEHMVSIPVASSAQEFSSFFTLPNFSYLSNLEVWKTAVTIAIVASLESLLSLDASDKLDRLKRKSPANRELLAQGAGNIVSGMLGGLPVTAVIVRSSANINAGAKTKLSAVMHGILLLVCVIFIPQYLNLIPLSALAGVLMFVGYKITKPAIFKEVYQKGQTQFLPFIITIIAILLSDLLIGIAIGIVSGLYFVLRSNYRKAVFIMHDGNNYLIRFRSEVSFLNKQKVKQWLEKIPAGSYVYVDASKSYFIDGDIIEAVVDFTNQAPLKDITVEFKPARNGVNHFNIENTTKE